MARCPNFESQGTRFQVSRVECEISLLKETGPTNGMHSFSQNEGLSWCEVCAFWGRLPMKCGF